MAKDDHRSVWSSDQGDLRKNRTAAPKRKSHAPDEQTVYLHRESKGRGGKAVSLVKNLVLSDDDMKELATRLKQLCGSGGTVKDGVIEIQGDHRESIAEALRKMGFKVKISGG